LKTNKNDTKQKRKRFSSEKGATLVEALVAFVIIAYVMTSIVGGIVQQQVTVKKTDERNAAVLLAEMQLEELFKFPADQQIDNDNIVNYIRYKNGGFEVIAAPVGQSEVKLFRRTTTVKRDLMRQVATITVLVEFGSKYNKVSAKYTFANKIQMSTRRALL
jgi:Tfp pilus assembly protein PilV